MLTPKLTQRHKGLGKGWEVIEMASWNLPPLLALNIDRKRELCDAHTNRLWPEKVISLLDLPWGDTGRPALVQLRGCGICRFTK